MKKAITLSESDLAKIIQKAVEKKLQEMKSNSSLQEAPEDDTYYDEDEEDDDPTPPT